MDNMLPGASTEHLFADCDMMLDPICSCCALPFLQCIHSMPQASYAAAQILFNEPTHYQSLQHDPSQAIHDLAPLVAYNNTQPLMGQTLWQMNANETTVQSATVQAHVEDIYTPGDRLGKPKSRRLANRRQAPRVGGFPCKYQGCSRVFDRACELNRHGKTHLDRSDRPHKCEFCAEAFLYPKDLLRHQRKHSEQSSSQDPFYCRYPGCGDLKGFSRRDNLLRHERKQHPLFVAAA